MEREEEFKKEHLYYVNHNGETLSDTIKKEDVNGNYNNFLPLLIPPLILVGLGYVIYKGIKYFKPASAKGAVDGGYVYDRPTETTTATKSTNPLIYIIGTAAVMTIGIVVFVKLTKKYTIK